MENDNENNLKKQNSKEIPPQNNEEEHSLKIKDKEDNEEIIENPEKLEIVQSPQKDLVNEEVKEKNAEDQNIEMVEIKPENNIVRNNNQMVSVNPETMYIPFNSEKCYDEVEKLHPRRNVDGKLEKYSTCSSSLGWFSFGKQTQTDMDSLGLGIIVYFRVLKTFSICFLLISLFNIPLYYIYTNANNNPPINYQDALFKTTVGNAASTKINCLMINQTQLINKSPFYIPLDCSKQLKIFQVLNFSIAKSASDFNYNKQVCVNFTTNNSITNLDSSCELGTYFNNSITNQCGNNNTSFCNVSFNYKNYQQFCKPSQNSFTNYFFLTYSCSEDDIIFADYIISRSNLAYTAVFIDIGSMVTLLFVLLLIPIFQEKTEKFYKESVTQINDYSLHLTDMDFNSESFFENLDDLIAHIDRILKKELPAKNIDTENLTKEPVVMYEINYPIITDEKLSKIMEKIEKLSEIENLNSKIRENDGDIDKLNVQLEKKNKELEIISDEVKAVESIALKKVDDIYLTFTLQTYADKLADLYKITKISRCCLICCCRKNEIQYLYFKDKWLNIKDFPDQPSNVKWQNVPYPNIKRFFRKVLSNLFAFIILIASFVIIIYSKKIQSQNATVFDNTIDCSYVDFSNVTLVYEEYAKGNFSLSTSMTKLNCFCKDQLSSNGLSVADKYKFNNTNICHDWVTAYIKFYSINIGIIIIVPVVNAILVILLKMITIFERNKSQTDDLFSNIWKIFVMQFINTALILLLVNANIPELSSSVVDFPVFTGKYTDLSPSWYQNIAPLIIFSLILNVFVPHIVVFADNWLTLISRCCDSGCSCDGKKTKCKTRADYLKLYKGPEFPIDCRYSELLTTIVVSLLFSSGIPILYLCCFVSLILTYFVDKFMILNYYASPPQYDLYLSKLFNTVILFGVIIHYCFGLWIYGNPDVFIDKNALISNTTNSYLNNFVSGVVGQNLATRLQLNHNIIILIFIGCLLAVVFIRYTFMHLLIKICCKPKHSEGDSTELNSALPLEGIYKIYYFRRLQYRKLKKLLNQKEIQNLYTNAFNYEKKSIKDKLFNLTKKSYPELEEDFDKNIENVMGSLNINDKSLIGQDFSYNIALLPEFEDTCRIHYTVE